MTGPAPDGSDNQPARNDHLNDHPSGGGLDPVSARALDALVEAGFDLDQVEPGMRDEAERVAGLLGMIGAEQPAGEQTSGRSAGMADRVLGAIRDGYETESTLSQNDGEALEAFVMSGYDASRVPGGLRGRASVHAAMLGAVTTLDAEGEEWIDAGRAVRTEAVLDAVESSELAPIPFEAPRATQRFRFADLVAAAAMLLLASAVALPVFNSMTEDGRRRVCNSNLQSAGLGFGLYAQSNNDALPMATAGFGGSWSQVGTPGKSHSANLFTLVTTKHVMPWDLDCPGNEFAPAGGVDPADQDWDSVEEVSYSYRLMPRGRNRLALLDSDAAVLSDRSPILISSVRGWRVTPETSSLNHGREGQHLLAVDGSVRWADSPVLENGDNIWLPRVVEQFVNTVRKKYGYIDGFEMPSTPGDTFLGP